MAPTDLRQFLETLDKAGMLMRVSETVDTRHQIAAYIRKTSDQRGPAVLFEQVKDFDMPVVGGVFAHRDLMLKALDVTEEHAIEHYLNALANPLPVRVIDTGPCQDKVQLGDEVDLGTLPAPIYSAEDTAAYLTAGVAISKDIDDGSKNASIYRFQIQGKNKLGVLAEPPHHLGIHYQKAEAAGQALEVAIAMGAAPAVQVATQWEAPYGTDELTLAGALQGEPLEVVKCKSVDLEVPASTEIVIEGRMLPNVREMEGPFGEYTGYYTDAYPKPVMEVTAITHRNAPIFQAMLTGEPTTENHVLKMIPAEASCYALLKQRFPSVQRVHLHGAGGVGLLAVVAMKPRVKNEARSVMTTMLGAQGTKVVIVVDEDVDIFDMDKVMWAVCTRSQPDQDLITLSNMMGWQLDPSAPERGTYSVMGIDATKPVGEDFSIVTKVPGVDNIPDF
jgi:2,5-furandicarboxylate decarboxylase 1